MIVSVEVLERVAATPPVCVHVTLWSVDPSLMVMFAFAVTVAPGSGLPVTVRVTVTGAVAAIAEPAKAASISDASSTRNVRLRFELLITICLLQLDCHWAVLRATEISAGSPPDASWTARLTDRQRARSNSWRDYDFGHEP